MTGFIDRSVWREFLQEFSERNQSRPARLEVYGGAVEIQEGKTYLPLLGVSYDPDAPERGSVEISFGGESSRDAEPVTHRVEHVERITPLVGTKMLEEGLGMEDEEGSKILLRFESLLELPEDTSH